MSLIDKMTNYHLDILKEIGNIGAGNAATSLSTLLNSKVHMEVPSVRLVGFDETMDIVGGPEEIIVAIFLRIQGELPGNMFFIVSPHRAEQFVHRITGDKQFSLASPPYEEMGLSVLHEVGNILAGSYLSALSDFTQLNVQPSVPSLSMDMAGAILSQGLMELSRESDSAIIIDTVISDDQNHEETLNGHFFLLPDFESYPKLFHTLGVLDS